MSSLIVEVVEFEKLPHPNADRLDIAKIKGKSWQCVVGKDWVGDNIGVYFPIESVLPESIIKAHNLENMTHNGRIRSVRLRGELSQGLLLPLKGLVDESTPVGTNLAETLGITKYIAPIPIHMSGEIESKPDGWQKYTDIENIKNFPDVLKEGEEVSCSEKIHGGNMQIMKHDNRLWVSSHNLCLKRSETNSYWRAVIPIEAKLLEKMREGDILYGELIGVQELKYGYEKGNVGIRFFDLFRDGVYVSTNIFRAWVKTVFDESYLVPIIYTGPFSFNAVEKLSQGDSIIANHIREGIVIKPLQERYDSKIGRVVLKFINDSYLLKGNRTEMH